MKRIYTLFAIIGFFALMSFGVKDKLFSLANIAQYEDDEYLEEVAMHMSADGLATCNSCHTAHGTNGPIIVIVDEGGAPGKVRPGETYTLELALDNFNAEAYPVTQVQTGGVSDDMMRQDGNFSTSHPAIIPAVNGAEGVQVLTLDNATIKDGRMLINWTAPADFNEATELQLHGLLANMDGSTDGDFAFDFSFKVEPNHADVVEGFKVFPTAAVNELNVEYLIDREQTVSIELISLTGSSAVVLKDNEATQAGQHSERYDLPSELANGYYILSLRAGNYAKTEKILVHH